MAVDEGVWRHNQVFLPVEGDILVVGGRVVAQHPVGDLARDVFLERGEGGVEGSAGVDHTGQVGAVLVAHQHVLHPVAVQVEGQQAAAAYVQGFAQAAGGSEHIAVALGGTPADAPPVVRLERVPQFPAGQILLHLHVLV